MAAIDAPDIAPRLGRPHYADDLDTMRHSTTHVMAKAVQRLYPGSKLGIGPTTDDGFFYDIDVAGQQLSTEDLPAIEAEMRRIVEADEPFVRREVSRDEALRAVHERGERFKVEIIESVPDEETLSFYDTGPDWTDLCRGPHVRGSGQIGAFKLLNVAGAYWRGDESRPMLQRIYGTAWPTREELEQYLWRIEEAKRRDHRVVGRDLGLFLFDDVAPGQPFWLPNGMQIIRELERLLLTELERRGYHEISTPSLVKSSLWEQSGHWGYYRENMFTSEVEDETYAFKPMNCPESTIVYRARTRSYRDLPIRLAQTDRLLRNERSGTLAGLLRVRQLTMDDAHIYCRPDQIGSEITALLEFGSMIYDLFGLERRYYLSTRPEKAMGDPALWERAEAELADALRANGVPFEVKPGEGAFYGPKIDVDIVDALGRPWQLTTIQADFNLPERFELEYVGEDGAPHRPVIIHRAIYGTYERFMAILIEHYAGAFPLWLAPTQVSVIPIADRHLEYAEAVASELRADGFRIEVDGRRERMQNKIRQAETQRVPYILVAGDRDIQANAVSVRARGEGDLGPMERAAFLQRVRVERAGRQ
ncbi:MAG: threonine--tRNA ligase [Chloroflexi bacterium]|nr:threonine--tRNA ligase [Chloroflexota bacterium]